MKKLTLKKRQPYHYDPRIHGVSQSMIAQWQECREKSRLNLVLGLTPTGVSVPFTYGSLSHGVIERCYVDVQIGAAKKLDDKYRRMGRWMDESEAEWLEEHPRISTGDSDMKEECIAILLEVLPRYFKRWHEDDSAVKWTHVEDKFSVPIKMRDGSIVHVVGRYDGVFLKRARQWLMETKNKQRWSDRMMDYLPLDLQLGVYLTALADTSGEDPHGVCYNLVRRPAERRGKKETLKAFASRIGENIAKDPNHYFQRLEIELSRQEKDEARARTYALVRSFYEWWKTVKLDERDLGWNSGACDGKYGVCSNLQICAHGDRSSHYVRKHASPELVSD